MEPLKFAIVSTDVIIMRMKAGIVEIAAQSVNRPPHYVNILGFIGGVLRPDETSKDSASRIIKEKTGLDSTKVFLHPLKFYDSIERDKRGRVVSLAYLGVINHTDEAGSGLEWLPLHTTKKLAYDHNEMLFDARTYLRNHLYISTIALLFMPSEFTIAELMTTYEYILSKKIDKRNFYKFAEELPIVATKQYLQQKRGRPAVIYKKAKNIEFFLS